MTGFAVKRVERDTLNDRVYEELRRAIMSGRFPPGTVITLRSLAHAVGTSEMPVRDAVRRLVVERALVTLPSRTVVVPVLNEATFAEICEIRIQLETLATARAAGRLSSRDIAALKEAIRQMASAHDQREYLERNQQFHFLIYASAERPMLLSMIESLWLQTGPLMNTVDLKAGETKARSHHTDAVEALERGDGATAAEAIAADIRDAAKFILEWIRAGQISSAAS